MPKKVPINAYQIGVYTAFGTPTSPVVKVGKGNQKVTEFTFSTMDLPLPAELVKDQLAWFVKEPKAADIWHVECQLRQGKLIRSIYLTEGN